MWPRLKKVYHESQIVSSYPVVLLCGSLFFLSISKTIFDLPLSVHRFCRMIGVKTGRKLLSQAQQHDKLFPASRFKIVNLYGCLSGRW